jgi:hypothetical protein
MRACHCFTQAAVEFKEKLAIGPSNVVDTAGAAVKVANKYSYMANAKTETVGAADGEQSSGRDADILAVSRAIRV